MAQYWRRQTFSILTIIETTAPNIYDAFTRETDPAEKMRLFYRWMSMLRYEVQQSRKFDRVVTMTEYDADYLRSYSPNANIRSIPIGIDPDEFVPWPETPDQRLQVVFLANFRHLPNIEAAEFLVKAIAPQLPELTFVICGSGLSGNLQGGPNVLFPGFVQDTRVLYRRPNTIVATPLFSGTGQRVKLLEAFAMACPVITSSVGAIGYPIRNGTDGFIADTAADFVKALRQLESSPELRKTMGMNGREMILRHFTWRELANRYHALIDECKAT
jgi:glycosyltransferase involved in cell wall biosynthesis